MGWYYTPKSVYAYHIQEKTVFGNGTRNDIRAINTNETHTTLLSNRNRRFRIPSSRRSIANLALLSLYLATFQTPLANFFKED